MITATKWFGGTDQDVFLTIFGSKGVTKEIQLTRKDPKKAKALFERGRCDMKMTSKYFRLDKINTVDNL